MSNRTAKGPDEGQSRVIDSLENGQKKKRREHRKKARRELLAGAGILLAKAAAFWCGGALLAAMICVSAYQIWSGSVPGPEAETPESEIPAAGAAGSGMRSESADDMPAVSDLTGDSEIRNIQEDAGNGLDEDAARKDETKVAALTFDDGPHPVYTERLLDGLKERGVQATFFVVGKNIPGNEELIARMEEEGHLIGNHTYDHVKICDMSQEDACSQVQKASDLVREITGHDTEFIRPPFGAWNNGLECNFVMIPVLWDVDPLDWTTSDTSLVVQRVVEETEDQDIILLHDYYSSSVEAALQIVDILQERGFEFVTVDELVLD